MASELGNGKPLHILFFPLMSPGHFIPMVDMARILASRGVRSTLVTTPANAATIPSSATDITVLTIPFPSPDQTNLPPGAENIATIPSSLFTAFTAALRLFRSPFDSLVRDVKPDCIMSDTLFPWTADTAADANIPRLTFQAAGAFPLFVTGAIFARLPLDESKESFAIDVLPPHKITLYRDGLPDLFKDIPFVMEMGAGEAKSYGAVVNTFREMEPAYVDFQKSLGKSTWCAGPVSLCNRSDSEKATRGRGPAAAAAKEPIVSWLDSKPEGSVIYVCFGSICHFGAAQLREIALGLERSGANFVWVVRDEPEGDAAAEEEWMPEGYEERVGERGLVVKGWAPQTVVLEHGAVGWFVTHCGWNSLQESVCAGVPMVTWPLFHEQFINAEMLVEVMGIGARMWEGFRKSDGKTAVVKEEEIAEVLKKVVGGGEEYEEMRRKAKELAAAANKAVEEGGSSYNDITELIEELKARRNNKE